MTTQDIRTLLVSADPKISHYFSVNTDRDYTYWKETKRLALTSDDGHDEAWRFYVHRFTRDEHDPVAELIFRTLDTDPRVTVSHTTDFEQDTKYIHHIFECEGY